MGNLDKPLKGAAAFTHRLKEYGGGVSMIAGLKRFGSEQKKEGFQSGINYALSHLSLLERILGRQIKR